jgi:TPR repeat protein
VHGIDIVVKQRRAVLARASLCGVLVQRLISFPSASRFKRPLHLVKRIISQRHFLGSRKNQAECLFQEGKRLLGEQRFSDAAKSWGQAALLHHADSHAFLSDMLLYDRPHLSMDDKRAFELAAAGAAMGSAHSKGVLGLCYVRGSGVSGDAARGLALGWESAAAGSCFGQFVVGWCYRRDAGVARDITQAERWLRLAAEQGHPTAQAILGEMYWLGETGVRNCAEAVRFHRLASAQGKDGSSFFLAGLYEDGDGVTRDIAEAVRLLRLAGEQGHRGDICLNRLLRIM